MTSFLTYSYYKPSRGGHAPGDLRDAFIAALDAYEAWETGEPEPTVELRDEQVTLTRLCGLLWNCTDVLPSYIAYQLAMLTNARAGSSYAGAARLLKQLIVAT